MKPITQIIKALCILLIPAIVLPQSARWVTVEHTMQVQSHMSIDRAKNDLLSLAREKAVAEVTGYRIRETSMLLQTELGGEETRWYESYQRLLTQQVQGKITREEEPSFKITTDAGAVSIYIKYRAEVTPDEVLPDPGFKIDSKTDRNIYQLGDNININVSVTQDSYITIFSILADGAAALIFPNSYMPNNFVRANTQRKIPNEIEREILRFTAISRENESPPYSELILCIATKEPVQFMSMDKAFEYNTHFTEINRWLVGIESWERTEAIINYMILE